MSMTISLPKFEGPLALLLYLIRKEEMDIMDIKIHEITNQYLEYIKLMKELDLEFAGEFIAMAATLIHIKSRMLLPQYDENGEIIEQEDPRKELVQKLLEYQKYQEAAKSLYERPLLGRDVWGRGLREKLEAPEEGIELEDNALFALITMYRRIVKSATKRIHKVAAKAQSIASRILEMKDRLIVGQRIALFDLVTATEEKGRQLLITFLSTLELGRMGFVNVYQTEAYSDIWIETKKPIETDVIARVQEFDNGDSAQAADALFNKPATPVVAENEIVEAFMHDEEAPTEEPNVQLTFDQPIAVDATPEEMASDDEILAMEAELFGHAGTAALDADIKTDFEVAPQTTSEEVAVTENGTGTITEMSFEEAPIASTDETPMISTDELPMEFEAAEEAASNDETPNLENTISTDLNNGDLEDGEKV
jgi:segregation and condensation protein A